MRKKEDCMAIVATPSDAITTTRSHYIMHMVAEYAFKFKIFFSNQLRLDASDKIYFPILHFIVPGSTLTGNMGIKAVT